MRYWQKKARTFGFKMTLASKRLRFKLGSLLSPESTAAQAEALFSTPHHFRRNLSEKQVLAEAQAFEVNTAQGPVKAWRWGQSEAIVGLVHGWAGRGSQFYAWNQPLLEAGLSVVTFDAPAHGDSPGTKSSLPEMAQAILAVQAATGPWIGVVGHSLGAAATLFALEFGLAAERAILLASPSDVQRMIMLFAKGMGLSEGVRQRMQARLEDRLGIEIDTLNMFQMAHRRKEKALFIHDLDDKEVNWSSGERLSQAWPGAQLITTKGLGHIRILRAPEVIDPARYFLTDSLGQRPISPNMQEILAHL
jgi:predicted alpha/beta hydrolase family esterase